MFSESVFKAYDIRGVYPNEINEELAIMIGKSFARFTGARVVAVGRDMRFSSSLLATNLINGLISQGVDVIDIGEVSTPMLNFSVASDDKIDAGIMITASHNPSQYNGMKMVLGDMSPICKGAGMEELFFGVNATDYQEAQVLGKIISRDVSDSYYDKVLSLVGHESFSPMLIVIDAGNGINGPIIREVLKKIPQIKMHELYMDPDGLFPNHEANPLAHETLDELRARVVEVGANFGVAFDGDGDRIGIVDERGSIIQGDLLTALIADFLLKRSVAGETIFYDLRSSRIVPEVIIENSGVARECRVGRSFIINAMRAEGAMFGGELSCHFYYRDFYSVESGDLTLLILLELLSKKQISLSSLIEPYRKYFQSGELNFEVRDKVGVINELSNVYESNSTRVTWLDGLKIEYEDFWFSVRASNTEPLLRLNIEANTQTLLDEKKNELISIIKKFG